MSDFSEEDAFFEVGKNSIRALELVTAAQARGIFLTVEQIFVHVALEFDARLFDEERMREVANVFWSKVQIAIA